MSNGKVIASDILMARFFVGGIDLRGDWRLVLGGFDVLV